MAGLSWDPARKTGVLEKMKEIAGTPTAHDLDLVCYLFGHDGGFIEHVSGEAGRNVDLSEKIYHSGDNTDGDADGDDEEISAELKDLPPYIAHMIVCALVRSGHKFGEIAAPEIRLADGYTNHNLLYTPLNHAEGKDKSAYVFAHLYRAPRSETGWNLHYVSQYRKYPGQPEFIETLKEYLI
jgi:tellurium resistance protein TerD